MSEQFDVKVAELIGEVRAIYGSGLVPLHRPIFEGSERRCLVECIDSNFVSSVGERVADFERRVADFVGARFAIATVNGTSALHVALKIVGVEPGDEVLTQALTFVATCNATSYCGAQPVFVDVDEDSLGMSPIALRRFLEGQTEQSSGVTVNRCTGRRIGACVPMHTFGLPCRIEEIVEVCQEFKVPIVEDAAESLGSYVGEVHTGTFGQVGAFSFNGNKIITTGGGGMIVTNDEALAVRAKHVTTTAKVPHAWEFVHDEVGYNYRLPNLNAALGCAQMERLPEMLDAKAEVARRYATALVGQDAIEPVRPRAGTRPNHWLNAVRLDSRMQRDRFLELTNQEGVMTRPIWKLMHHLEMFANCQHDGLEVSSRLENQIVNLPSSVPSLRSAEGELGK